MSATTPTFLGGSRWTPSRSSRTSSPGWAKVGLGAMGAAIASTLGGHGHPTTVWNRAAVEAPAGALEAATAAEAVPWCSSACSTLRLCATCSRPPPAGSPAGLSCISPAARPSSRDTAAWVTERGAEYLDGGILADPENVGTPQTSFPYSGSQRGSAAVCFIALVGAGYDTWLAYLDALALGAAERVDATALGPFLSGMFGSMTGLLDGMARAADEGEHPPAAGPLNVHAALMDDVIDPRRARGVDTVQLERVKTLVDRRVARGHGDEGFSSLIEELRGAAA